MNQKEIMSRVDHTLLAQTATWEEIRKTCDEGMKYGAASVCIPPVFVKKAAEYLQKKLSVCTVIGFPNGYHTQAVKMMEAKDAIEHGADEIDMVIHMGNVKEGNYKKILQEIKEIKEICGEHILKVIIETCLLSKEEKVILCQVVSDSGADYIKTSTGFSMAGATFEDIVLFQENVAPHVKIKAAGGIQSFQDAEKFIQLGADRLGTSRLVKILENDEQ